VIYSTLSVDTTSDNPLCSEIVTAAIRTRETYCPLYSVWRYYNLLSALCSSAPSLFFLSIGHSLSTEWRLRRRLPTEYSHSFPSLVILFICFFCLLFAFLRLCRFRFRLNDGSEEGFLRNAFGLSSPFLFICLFCSLFVFLRLHIFSVD
jgi:hypothetical protein